MSNFPDTPIARSAQSRPTALVIDDEPDIAELLSLTLNKMDISVSTALGVEDAKLKISSNHYDLCLTDMRMGDGDGLGLLAWMHDHSPSTPVAVVTAHGNVESAVRALKLGAFDFVSKPIDLDALRKLVKSAIKLSRPGASQPAVSEQSLTDDPVQRLLGVSEAVQEIRKLIIRVSRSQAPVHVSGESGTGKELVARLIHECGPRKDGPFMAVNCGAIPSELLESEFFGHKRGSFTGAVVDKVGLIESAEGGTLFLDEIADLPLHMQVKLLRAVQEKSVRPVGSSLEKNVDVRVISATHKDLKGMVSHGTFRQDLYYRINVIELNIPPLRARVDDIPILAEAILEKLSRRLSGFPQGSGGLRPLSHISENALNALKSYVFPGNIRELENILERAITLSADGVITEQHLALNDDLAVRTRYLYRNTSPLPSGTDLEQHLLAIEREAIFAALNSANGNKTKAASLLGISFRTLRYRLKKLGIDR